MLARLLCLVKIQRARLVYFRCIPILKFMSQFNVCLTMKNSAIFFLLCLGIGGCTVCRADALLFFKSHREKGMKGVLDVVE